ncbi:hypothetical protein ACQY0O_007553 [Thecaphora frezii]
MLSRLFPTTPAYPQRRCFFCQTDSVILPPYSSSSASASTSAAHPRTSSSASNSPSTSALTISTGTADNWLCSSCQCPNYYDQHGNFQDHYTRPMWDEQYNNDRNQLLKHQLSIQSRKQRGTDAPLPSAALASAPASAPGSASLQCDSNSGPAAGQHDQRLFCHTCQTNQTLQVNLLSDYLPDEADPEYPEKLRALPAYRASIAARYPSVCEACAPAVQSRIEERDQMARSWTLAQWLVRTNDARHGPTNIDGGALDPNTPLQSAAADSAGRRRNEALVAASARQARIRAEMCWLYRGVSWTLSTVAMLACYALASIRPGHVREALLVAEYIVIEEPLSGANAALLAALTTLVVALVSGRGWDPTGRRVARARSRGVRPEVQGLQGWNRCTELLFALRLAAIGLMVAQVAVSSLYDGLPISSDVDWAVQSWGIVALSTEASLLLVALFQLRVRMPPTMRLVSRPLYSQTSQPAAAHVEAEDPLSLLSLAERRGSFPHFPPALGPHRGVPALPALHAARLESLLAPSVPASVPAPPLQSTVHANRDADGDEIMRYSPSSATHTELSINEDENSPTSYKQPNSLRPWGSAATGWPNATQQQQQRKRTEAHEFALGQQRFWEPQKPTGLEEVFGKAVSLNDEQRQEGGGKKAWWDVLRR